MSAPSLQAARLTGCLKASELQVADDVRRRFYRRTHRVSPPRDHVERGWSLGGYFRSWLVLGLIAFAVGNSFGEAPSVPESEAPMHWALIPPAPAPVPSVRDAAWGRNAIDAFVLARLEQDGIGPSPEADRATLIRRLSLDLLGLPPDPARVRAFLTDTRPDAYELLVKELLASPHFGEQWGRHWLDLARYADSDGYEKDNVRPDAWRYRDWVVDAVNQDMPFDVFTILQLAGDLLPDAGMHEKLATGFHRNTLTNTEGGVDQEEFRCKAVVDRVGTTGTVWLGLTLGCAECHTHKYDPISQREFFQLYAFFNQADEVDLPALLEPERIAFEKALAEWERRRDALQQEREAAPGGEASADRRAELEQSLKTIEERKPKPKLNELHGQKVPESMVKDMRFAFIQKESAVLMGSPRTFRRHGQCGMDFSDLLPNLATCADDIGWSVTEEPVHINDLHATLLHAFGLDHTRLTYRFQGRDYRLTDVAGRVVTKLLA